MATPVNQARVRQLLAEISSELGFSLAGRDPARFESLVKQGVDAFTDGVLIEEGLDPKSEKRLRIQVRSLVDRHFTAWDLEGAA